PDTRRAALSGRGDRRGGRSVLPLPAADAVRTAGGHRHGGSQGDPATTWGTDGRVDACARPGARRRDSRGARPPDGVDGKPRSGGVDARSLTAGGLPGEERLQRRTTTHDHAILAFP